MDLLTALKYQIWMQQFLLLAPYRIKNGRAVASLFMTLYTCISVGWYFVALILVGHYASSDDLVKVQFRNGYLWGIIGTFELSFSNVSYPLMLFYMWIYRGRQIRLLNSIADIDAVLQHEFGVDTGKFNALGRKRSFVFFVVLAIYFWTLWLLWFIYIMPRSYLANKAFMFLLVANQAQQGSMGLLTWTIILYCQLIRKRFDMLQQIDLDEILRLSDEQQRRRLMTTWLTTFRDLCRVIEQISENLGLLIAWRYSHDFTLLISQLYLVYWIVESGGSGSSVVGVLFWAIQNVMKIWGIGISADQATEKMRECGAKANALNKIGMDRVVKQMLDSFGLWLLHRKIRFTANNFFTVDLTLVYAVIGALASYLLILIQFKQQEESLTQINSNMSLSPPDR